MQFSEHWAGGCDAVVEQELQCKGGEKCMSFPNIPDITPEISLSRTEVINLLFASVAMEELGLAHIVNAEAEKIQAAVGTLPNSSAVAKDLSELLAINESVNGTLQSAIKKEMLLEFKLEEILKIPPIAPTIHVDTATATTNYHGLNVTDSDSAYYYTENQ